MKYIQQITKLKIIIIKVKKIISEYLGTPYQYYAVYEKGTSEISFERAILLAKYYNVSLDYIAGLTNNKRGLSFGELTEEQQMLLQFVEKLTPDERQNLSKLLKILSDNIK